MTPLRAEEYARRYLRKVRELQDDVAEALALALIDSLPSKEDRRTERRNFSTD
jgi:hypothetical protein